MPWPPAELSRFVERYQLAHEAARRDQPKRGTSGLELEWNLLDASFRPVQRIGSGPEARSFIDALRQDGLPGWLASYHQLEVFHWMTEWATRPHDTPRATIYEARLLEACLWNALARAGRPYGETLVAWHGNLLTPVQVDHASIPGGWGLAKRRYLERCVDLYGADLATAGLHTNLSLPEPLLSWDFLHLPPSQRGDRHLDDYKNQVYIDGTRKMRAFCALFVAIAASTPLQADPHGDGRTILLTDFDSVRNLTFPNPATLDVPGLYRSHADYLRISYALVRSGARFGNNNWTPVRARSFAEPVERLIDVTGEQLQALYRRGLYAHGEAPSLEQLAADIEIQNLLARIDLPMARVEVRTDEGGHSLDLDVALVSLKELLLIRGYADSAFADSFAYDEAALARARRNETAAARDGLRSNIEDPFSGAPVGMRAFLRWTLDELKPLAEALGRAGELEPLEAMASGAPNTAEQLRQALRPTADAHGRVPVETLMGVAQQRRGRVELDVERIAGDILSGAPEYAKLEELYWKARDEARHDPSAPIRFRPAVGSRIESAYPDKTAEIVDLAKHLIRIPSVSEVVPELERLQDIRRAATFVHDYLRQAGLDVHADERGRYPAVLATFPEGSIPHVLLCGHVDVVAPDPDEGQFEPHMEGDYLWGRGAADMKTVVATFLTWMKDDRLAGGPFPPIGLLLVGNEEIGEGEPVGTPHVLADMLAGTGRGPDLLIAGERTGEGGDERFGEVCLENRGLVRVELVVRGRRAHTGIGSAPVDMSARILDVRARIVAALGGSLTLDGPAGWSSQVRFPYIEVGRPGRYNVSPDTGRLGIEIRLIPEDSLDTILSIMEDTARSADMEFRRVTAEPGVSCDPALPLVRSLLAAIEEVGGRPPRRGRKLPATSARFAPGGRGLVWGQSGIGPHAADERHFVPSIDPYYRSLAAFGRRLTSLDTNHGPGGEPLQSAKRDRGENPAKDLEPTPQPKGRRA
jgi:acetylornithine deacetylase/succinyl-diaminopimelate desuccinylase-like protein/gamma-glutamyl:cysteine ligase YbdK (ATP-grasp superfamily)